MNVKSLAGIGSVVPQKKGNRKQVEKEQPKREYREFADMDAVNGAMEAAIDAASVTDDDTITAYQNVVAGGLLSQSEGYGPWVPAYKLVQAGSNADTLLKAEAAGLIKRTVASGNKGRYSIYCARLFFLDAGNVKRTTADNGIGAITAMFNRRKASGE